MDKLLGLFLYLKRKWDEPSTHASLCAVCAYAGVHVDPGLVQDFFNVATIFFGGLGFFFNEAKPKVTIE